MATRRGHELIRARGRRFQRFVTGLLQPNAPDRPAEVIGPDPVVVDMLRGLGRAMVQSGRATNETRERLEQIAAAYGRPEIRVLVAPTSIMVQLAGDSMTTEIDSIDTAALRLDQIGAIDKLVLEARAGTVGPGVVLERLQEILESSPRFNRTLRVFGHVLLTLGFGLALEPTVAALPAYAILGAIVGVLVAFARPGTILGEALPIIASITVTVVTGTLLEWSVRDDPIRVITPALVSFLPGLVLTIAALELTHGEVVAGASRLVYGFSQLLVLAFGLVVGLTLVGEFSPSASPEQLGWWAPLLGVVLTACGYVLFAGAPPGAAPWFVLVLLLVQSAQRLGNELLSPELSGFVGALIIIPLTRAIEVIPRGPSAAMTMLPALWLLVPGALGFMGVSEAATYRASGFETLVSTGLAMFSISLGVLIGSGLVRDARRARSTWINVR